MEVKTAHPFEVNENEKKLTIEEIFEKYGKLHRQTIECIAVCMPYREAKELTPHIGPYDEDAEGFLLKTVDVPGKYIWVPFDYFESNFVKYDTHIDRCWVEKEELSKKINKLSDFVKGNAFDKLDAATKILLHQQLDAMQDYYINLMLRLEREELKNQNNKMWQTIQTLTNSKSPSMAIETPVSEDDPFDPSRYNTKNNNQ